MRKFHQFIFLLPVVLILQGCDPGTSANEIDEITASEERQFVWNGLNFWYYWQDRVPELADERKSDVRSFNQLLNEPNDERALFDRLIFSQEDDFSWFIDDYEEHEAARVGRSKSFGFRFGLAQESESNNVFGFVQYVVEGAPADKAGLKRGDIFMGINGENLTINNFSNLLNNEQYDLKMASVRRVGNRYRIEEKDEVLQMISEEITENPIHTFNVHDTGSGKVGYLLYNAFRFNFHKELNDVFGTFKDQGINELVLDLRFNGGGSLLTSALLASMISSQGENSIFAELRYSNKRSSNAPEPFTFYNKVPIIDDSGSLVSDDTVLNSLGLSRVYILASNRTASASETVINGLKPYGVEVVVIGEPTIGKDEGSITVYDAPGALYSPRTSQQRAMINPNHKRAMQPIIFKIFNADGEDYPNGFAIAPGTTIQRDFDFLEGGLIPLGDPEEQLFKTALDHMKGSVIAKERIGTEMDRSMHIMDSSELIPFYDDMFLLPFDLERVTKKQE